MGSTPKKRRKRENYIQPSPISPLFPQGFGVEWDDETIIIDFFYRPPDTKDAYVLARVALTPSVAEYLRGSIDKFLTDVAKAKTKKRQPSQKT